MILPVLIEVIYSPILKHVFAGKKFAPEFIKELEQLQDNVPPFPSATAIAIVENGLGKKIDERLLDAVKKDA